MPLTLKPGVRLFSAVCSTAMIVVKAPATAVAFTIGGVEPSTSPESAGARSDGPVDGHDAGTAMGKRYVDAAGSLEVLCTQPGTGTPAVDGVLMQLKESKPLPASD